MTKHSLINCSTQRDYSMTVNAHGLNRNIPSDVKRQVRQKCGFGCVICGLAIVQYEHVEPEFKDAKFHDPDSITLLCPQCHAKITTKMWSKARVKLAMKAPKCRQIGYTREFFDFSDKHPALRFGGMLLKNCPIPIQVGDYQLFSIKPPENPGEPYLFSGFFTDSYGAASLVICDNEWQAYSNIWDIEVQGPSITIREKRGEIHLILRVNPPNEIIVERLKMSLCGISFDANGDLLKVTHPNGATANFTSCLADNCQVGLFIAN